MHIIHVGTMRLGARPTTITPSLKNGTPTLAREVYIFLYLYIHLFTLICMYNYIHLFGHIVVCIYTYSNMYNHP
jgi:hypothetical protein